MRKASEGISLNVLENHEFPFGLVSYGEVLMDYKKIGTFAYSFDNGDYFLRINPRYQGVFDQRIQHCLLRNTVYKNDVSYILHNLLKCEIHKKELYVSV